MHVKNATKKICEHNIYSHESNIVLHFKHCITLKCNLFIPALARDIISDKKYVN